MKNHSPISRKRLRAFDRDYAPTHRCHMLGFDSQLIVLSALMTRRIGHETLVISEDLEDPLLIFC
jgi:hypothetical protein